MSKRPMSYFIREHLEQPYQDGSIGFTDAERILLSEDYQPIFLPCHNSFSVAAKIRRFFAVLKIVITLPSGSIVVFLLPQYASLNKWMVKLLGYRRSVKRVALLGDINGIKHNDPGLLERELMEFSGYNFFIVHNEWMKNWVTHNIPGAHCSKIQFFDFLATPVEHPVNRNDSIAYAGNLQEAGFLNRTGELADGNDAPLFKVYGQPYTSAMAAQPNLEYMGTSDPYELVQKLRASYGLIWYGNSLTSIQGNIGPYLSLISPHKASLYLLCGIPLIVPEGTAIADLVEQYGCGIVVKSLYELRASINAVSASEYAGLCANARKLAKQISAGEGLRNALHEMQKALEGGLSQ